MNVFLQMWRPLQKTRSSSHAGRGGH
jgi:hypothetical protein